MWVPKCQNSRGSKTSTVPVVWATFGIFSFDAIQMTSCHDWWPWAKPGYITTTRRQSNNQWSGGIAAYPIPSQKNSLEKFSPRFFAIKTASSWVIIFQSAKLSTRSISHLFLCNWRTCWRKTATGNSPRWSCSCTTRPRLTGQLKPRRNWSTWASCILITHPILRIWPLRTTTCSVNWKTIKRYPFFPDTGVISAVET
jgi:hypothetical protein